MLSDNILFVISMFTTILWNKMKYPALPFQENNIQVYDTIPVKSKQIGRAHV